ncbi:ankyrin repeat-containing domain protein [Colletotrichum navitas]|uniref:Ankyrin repeat-containing domain protein n=1 Tax=Colletotrichum navitas TaxID=681940 RepID=A0AAD8PXJ4_9PEZI|nr:ankyrin repeat-containing domain protein [Colletotrichum navitas]KAK1589776.1 ankyrin repeat-containing domain protein [Colletotrichum navitas]
MYTTPRASSCRPSMVAISQVLFRAVDRYGSWRKEHNKVIEVLLDVLPQTDGWAPLMSQQYSDLPVSIQSALNRLFKEAILRSDLTLVRSLIRVGIDANQPLTSILQQYLIHRAATAFEYAIFTNDRPLIQLLVELDANHPSSNLELTRSAWGYRNAPGTTLGSMTSLLSNFVFCQEDDEEACKLPEQIASVEACPITRQVFEFFRTRLHTPASKPELLASAIKARSRIVLNLLLEDQDHFGAYVNHPTRVGATPIMAAIDTGDTKLLERLVHQGASLDLPSSTLTTCSPLQYAAYVSDADMLQKLLWHGAKINYTHPSSSRFAWPLGNSNDYKADFTYIGKTALQSAFLWDNNENAIFLLEAGPELVGSELAIAIASRQDAVVDELLIKGASFEETSAISDAISVLETVALTEDMALISQIIKNSSQTVVASSLWAAIFVAESTSDLSIFEFLLGHISVASHSDVLGSNIRATSRQGNLPLVEKLKNLGADINAPAGVRGATALQYASIGGYFGLVRRLLEFQADPNALGAWCSTGRTALEGAAEHGKLDVVQLLLNSGVKTVGSGRLQYVRAIRFAQSEGHHAVARLIKSHRPWEEADQRLYDDKKLLGCGHNYESDEGVDKETDEEYGSSRGTSEAECEVSGVPCEVPGETFEVDDGKGGDPDTAFGGDEELPGYPTLVPVGIEEGLAHGVDEGLERPGDLIWTEAYETFISELPWLMRKDIELDTMNEIRD